MQKEHGVRMVAITALLVSGAGLFISLQPQVEAGRIGLATDAVVSVAQVQQQVDALAANVQAIKVSEGIVAGDVVTAQVAGNDKIVMCRTKGQQDDSVIIKERELAKAVMVAHLNVEKQLKLNPQDVAAIVVVTDRLDKAKNDYLNHLRLNDLVIVEADINASDGLTKAGFLPCGGSAVIPDFKSCEQGGLDDVDVIKVIDDIGAIVKPGDVIAHPTDPILSIDLRKGGCDHIKKIHDLLFVEKVTAATR